MAETSRNGAVVVLQNTVSTAVPGTTIDVSRAKSVILEVSGTPSGIVGNFEGSTDGSSWFAVGCLSLGVIPQVNSLTAAAAGLFRLENPAGLKSFRVRTSGSGGSMTVKAVPSA